VNLKDTDGDAALSVCEEPECADLLITAGADLTAVNGEGQSALHVAHENYWDEMVTYFTQLYNERGIPLPELPNRDADEDEEQGEMSDDEDDDQ
jgi:hypothetical protein